MSLAVFTRHLIYLCCLLALVLPMENILTFQQNLLLCFFKRGIIELLGIKEFSLCRIYYRMLDACSSGLLLVILLKAIIFLRLVKTG